VFRSFFEKASLWIETNLLFWNLVVFLAENILPAACNREAMAHILGNVYF
jgi:hypothetical protein